MTTQETEEQPTDLETPAEKLANVSIFKTFFWCFSYVFAYAVFAGAIFGSPLPIIGTLLGAGLAIAMSFAPALLFATMATVVKIVPGPRRFAAAHPFVTGASLGTVAVVLVWLTAFLSRTHLAFMIPADKDELVDLSLIFFPIVIVVGARAYGEYLDRVGIKNKRFPLAAYCVACVFSMVVEGLSSYWA